MRPALLLVSLDLLLSVSVAAQEKSKPVLKPAKLSEVSIRQGNEGGASTSKLPVRRVVLYKNGVGYFEHLGQVHGSQNVHIDFSSAQLNDVLKSLTALDLSGGRITGVEYNSEAPLARRLATLRLSLGERPTTAEFLGALRGARLEVRSGAGPLLAGRLLSVERKTRTGAGPGWTVETDEISLVNDGGEVRSVDLNSSTSVRVVEKDLQLEVGRYLGLIASSRDQDIRRMNISTTGTGDRSLYVSYISEVPIWKTTYRIVLPSKADKKPLLQGWAIVDNTVGEDWDNVELSLVAGAPHSFIQQLSEPFYGRRPEVDLPENVQLSPQTHGAMLTRGNGRLTGLVTDAQGAAMSGANVRLLDESNNVVAQTNAESNGQYNFSGIAAGRYRLEVAQSGYRTNAINRLNVSPGENRFNTQLNIGAATETVEVRADASTVESTTSGFGGGVLRGTANRPHVATNGRDVAPLLLEPLGFASATDRFSRYDAASELESDAEAEDLGDLFEYNLKDRVTLKKNQSALVPIVHTEIEAEKISVWNNTSGSGRPLRGLWLKNDSPLTLDGGSFSVLENEVFAGEGLTDPIKPGERRIVSYATDLGLMVEAARNDQPQHVARVKIAKGVLTQVSELHQRTLYTVRNQGDTTGILVVEHPARNDWQLVKSAKEPDEKAAGLYRFRMEVPSKATASMPVEEVKTLSSTYQLSSLTDAQIALFVKQNTITIEMGAALEKITAQKAAVAKLEDEMENRQKDIDRIVEDQGRLRENMKALRGTAEEKALVQRYTKQLDEQENQLEALRKAIQNTEAQRDKVNDTLEAMIADLQLEATL